MRRIVLSFALTAALALLLTLSAVPAFAATASTHTHNRPYCAPPHSLQHNASPRGCYGCNAVQEGYNHTSQGGYTLEVYLYIGYDNNWNYCGWDESVAWVYQPPHQQVGTLYDYACANFVCNGLSVNVTPRGTGTWWYDGEPADFPNANQCATAKASYESLDTSISCVYP